MWETKADEYSLWCRKLHDIVQQEWLVEEAVSSLRLLRMIRMRLDQVWNEVEAWWQQQSSTPEKKVRVLVSKSLLFHKIFWKKYGTKEIDRWNIGLKTSNWLSNFSAKGSSNGLGTVYILRKHFLGFFGPAHPLYNYKHIKHYAYPPHILRKIMVIPILFINFSMFYST